MLWKKESTKQNAVYVDLFSLNGNLLNAEYCEQRKTAENISFDKSDEISRQKRLEGNEIFLKGGWLNAMHKYNDSVCYAAQG